MCSDCVIYGEDSEEEQALRALRHLGNRGPRVA
jgi:hypothetical protein